MVYFSKILMEFRYFESFSIVNPLWTQKLQVFYKYFNYKSESTDPRGTNPNTNQKFSNI